MVEDTKPEVPDVKDDLSDLIARLREEKAEWDSATRELGFEEGVLFAREEACYHEFRGFERVRDAKQLADLELPPPEEELMLKYFAEHGFANTAPYQEGWLAGVMSVWDRVKGKLDSQGVEGC